MMPAYKHTGILAAGVAIPRSRIRLSEISRNRGAIDHARFGEAAKSVSGRDEDAATLGVEAAINALHRSCCPAHELRAVFFGSESKPYAVKPAAVTVASAIGAGPDIAAADLEFACKAGTEALRTALLHAAVSTGTRALAVAADCAQSRPGDELEYTAGAGAAAFVVGSAKDAIAIVEATTAIATDTLDFFRRAGQSFPVHGHRFTGQPAYFAHTLECASKILDETKLRPADFAHAVLHQPNGRFPREVAKMLGFSSSQIEAGMLVDSIGNTYAASSLLGLAAVLDVAEPGQLILCVSYGSGAGADGFVFRVTSRISERRNLAPRVREYVAQSEFVDYATYLRLTGAIRTS